MYTAFSSHTKTSHTHTIAQLHTYIKINELKTQISAKMADRMLILYV